MNNLEHNDQQYIYVVESQRAAGLKGLVTLHYFHLDVKNKLLYIHLLNQKIISHPKDLHQVNWTEKQICM